MDIKNKQLLIQRYSLSFDYEEEVNRWKDELNALIEHDKKLYELAFNLATDLIDLETNSEN